MTIDLSSAGLAKMRRRINPEDCEPSSILALIDALEEARAALRKFQTDMCEGWCEDGGLFHDCQGCEARAALEGKAAP